MNAQAAADVVRYETPAAAHRLLGLSCTGYGATAQKTQACGPRALDCYAAVYVSRGAGWIETAASAGRARLGDGALIWLYPGVAHTYAPDASGWTEQWVMFEGPLADTSERLGFLSRARPVQRVGDAPEITALFDGMRQDVLGGGPLAGVRAATLVYRLIVVAYDLGSGAGTPITEDAPAAREVRLALARLEERAFQPVDMEAIARDCAMGYSTLRRRFKQATGYSPKEYILRVRLSRAKELLMLTSRSVTEIAAAVGFDDPYYFSRLFRHKEGLSPTRFRAQQQAGRGMPLSSSRTT